MDGIYNSSTRGKMAASFKTKVLMKALREATFEHKQTDSVATATALSESRADIVAYISKLEANLAPRRVDQQPPSWWLSSPKRAEQQRRKASFVVCGGRGRCEICDKQYIRERKPEYAVTPWAGVPKASRTCIRQGGLPPPRYQLLGNHMERLALRPHQQTTVDYALRAARTAGKSLFNQQLGREYRKMAPRPGHPIWYGVDEAAKFSEVSLAKLNVKPPRWLVESGFSWRDFDRYVKADVSRPPYAGELYDLFAQSYFLKPLSTRVTPASVWGIA